MAYVDAYALLDDAAQSFLGKCALPICEHPETSMFRTLWQSAVDHPSIANITSHFAAMWTSSDKVAGSYLQMRCQLYIETLDAWECAFGVYLLCVQVLPRDDHERFEAFSTWLLQYMHYFGDAMERHGIDLGTFVQMVQLTEQPHYMRLWRHPKITHALRAIWPDISDPQEYIARMNMVPLDQAFPSSVHAGLHVHAVFGQSFAQAWSVVGGLGRNGGGDVGLLDLDGC